MSYQIRCRNCGGYKITEEIKQISTKTGKEYEAKRLKNLRIFIIAWIPLVLMGTIFSFYINQPVNILVVIAYIIFVALIYYVYFSVYLGKLVNKYYYTCSLCGFKWSRREGEPLYPDNMPEDIQPGLLQKGIELKKKEEAAAYAAWYQQEQARRQNKK